MQEISELIKEQVKKNVEELLPQAIARLQMPELMSIRQASTLTGLSHVTIARLIKEGQIHPVKIPGLRHMKVRKSDILHLAKDAKAPKVRA